MPRKAKPKTERTPVITPKQEAFIAFYLIHWNMTKAAKLAGYRSPRQAGSSLMSKPYINARVREQLDELKLTADEVLTRLGQQARGTMADFIEVNDKGQFTFNLKKAQAAQQLGMVKKLSVRPTEFGPAIEFELYDAQSALGLLGKHHKLFTDRVEIRDWQDQAIEDIRRGELAYEPLAEEFGDDLATQLFQRAGVPIQS